MHSLGFIMLNDLMYLDQSLLTQLLGRVSGNGGSPATKADTGREYLNQVLKSTGHIQAHAPKGQCPRKDTLYQGHGDWGRLMMTGEG